MRTYKCLNQLYYQIILSRTICLELKFSYLMHDTCHKTMKKKGERDKNDKIWINNHIRIVFPYVEKIYYRDIMYFNKTLWGSLLRLGLQWENYGLSLDVQNRCAKVQKWWITLSVSVLWQRQAAQDLKVWGTSWDAVSKTSTSPSPPSLKTNQKDETNGIHSRKSH